MSLLPNRILGLDGGTFSQGRAADITIINPDEKWTIDARQFYSKGRNTPFDGFEAHGAVAYTLVNGAVVYESKKI
jgi:dihydroorotase